MPEPDLLDDSLAAFRTSLRDTFPPISSEAWWQQIEQDLREKNPQERLQWHPIEGFEVDAFWRRDDLEQPLASPAEPPPSPWLLNVPIQADEDAAETNQRIREALDGGADALTLAGAGWHYALQGTDLSTIPLHVEAGPLARLALAQLLEEADAQKIDPARLRGSVSFDPLLPLLQQGTAPLSAFFNESTRLLQDLNADNLALDGLAIDTRPYHDAGATAVEEVAYALAATSEVLHQLLERGLPAEQFTGRVRWHVAVDTSFLLEIAKLRALRRLLRTVLEAYEAETAEPYIHTITSPRSLTVYDPHTNLLRTTTQAASAIIGGCQEVTILPYDTLLNQQSAHARRLARNIGLILRHETHLGHVADAAAGSYYVEQLTDRLAREAWSLFQEVEAQGGLLAALAAGSVQERLAALRERRSEALNRRKHVLIGTNQYPNPSESALDSFGKESNALVSQHLPDDRSLEDLREGFRKGKTVEALTREASAGERSITPLPKWRAAASFEALRLRMEAFASKTGQRPRLVLLPFGDPVMASARATFAFNLLGCAGFETIEAPLSDFEAGYEEALATSPDAVVLCSSDDGYREHGFTLIRRLKAVAPALPILLAGPPEAVDEAVRDAIDLFIHRKVDAFDTLRTIQEILGVLTT